MKDKTYTFHRGPDTVHVTVGRADMGRTRRRILMVMAAVVLATLPLGIAFPPFLIVTGVLVFVLYGKILMIEQICREKAEAKANREFDQMESDRWRAYAALRKF